MAQEIKIDKEVILIGVKLIENAVLVRVGGRWVSFPDWDGSDGASEHVFQRIKALKSKRGVAP